MVVLVVAVCAAAICAERGGVQPLVHVVSSSEEIVGSRHEEVSTMIQRHVTHHCKDILQESGVPHVYTSTRDCLSHGTAC